MPHLVARPAGRTAVGRVWGEVRHGFREGKQQLRPGAWRAWWRVVGVGVLAMVVLMLLLVFVGRELAASGALDGEPDMLRWLGEHGPLPFYSGVFFQTIGTDITLYILLAFTAGLAAWYRRPLTCLSILAAFVVVDLIVRLGWASWARARPDVLYEGVASPGFHAFPSGHTAKTVAVYGLLTWIWIRASNSVLERAFAVLVLAFVLVLVPLGRLTMGVHWPSDVAAGMLLGFAWFAVLAFGLRHERF